MGEDLSQLGSGLHVFTAFASLEYAGRLATELSADLCVTTEEAHVVLAERRALPPVSLEDVAVLRVLADRVTVADRIVTDTRERAALEVAERLAETGAGMAVHPVTIRDRAAALVDARRQREQAEQLLAAHDQVVAEQGRASAPLEAPTPPPVTFEDLPGPALVPDEPPRKGGFFARFRRARIEVAEDTSASTDLLRQMAAATDEAFGARRAAEVRDDQRALLQARWVSADERVRVAARAWWELAGDDVEPDEVEAVIRRYDPQHQEALVVAGDTVHVRAVSRLLGSAVERWDEAWARLGLDAPPASEALAVVDELSANLGRPVVVVGEAVDQAATLARELPTTAVVAVEDAQDSIEEGVLDEEVS